MPAEETNANLVRLYNSTQWRKGYWCSTNKAIWNNDSQTSLELLHTDASMTYANLSDRYAIWPHIVRTMMRMDHFRLVPRSDLNIRCIQRRLNSLCVTEVRILAMGLVPCDGIYSRDVRQRFMMAVWCELGITLTHLPTLEGSSHAQKCTQNRNCDCSCLTVNHRSQHSPCRASYSVAVQLVLAGH